MANTYDIGDQVRFTGTFTNASATVIDPDVVSWKIKSPAGVTTTYIYGTDAELIKLSTGIYYADFTITASGYWYHRFYSTGTGTAAGEAYVLVRGTNFA